MAALDNLPSEILTEILSLLTNADLAGTSRLSHRLHDVSLPLLYRAPDLNNVGPVTRLPSLEIFLCTLLTPGNERLATHVRSLHWHCYEPERGQTWRFPSEEAIVAPAASRFGLRGSLGTEGGKFVLLIHLLPSLRVLNITPPAARSHFTKLMESHYTARALPAVSPTLPPVLQSLREFHTLHGISGSGISPRTLMALLMLPCITLIDAQILNRNPPPLLAVAGTAASSPIKKLRISHWSASLAYLTVILRVPTALTHFSYSTVRYLHRFQLDDFWTMMQPLRGSVQYLYLDLKLASLETKAHGGQSARSLREWRALRTLSCSMVALLARRQPGMPTRWVDYLPLGLLELEIMEDYNWSFVEVVDELVELLGMKKVVVPALERLAVGTHSERNQVALEKLRAAADAAGVTIVESSFYW